MPKRMSTEMFRRFRLGNLRGLFLHRWGRPLPGPDDDQGREDLEELLYPISLGPKPEEAMTFEIEEQAPWLSTDEAQRLIAHVLSLPRKVRMPTGKALGERQRVTNLERERLSLWTIRPFDTSKEQLVEQRKAKARAREQKRRQKRGAQSRDAYLAQFKKPKPWEVAGVSKSTLYRQRKAARDVRSNPVPKYLHDVRSNPVSIK